MRHEKRYCSSSMRHTVGGFFLSSYIGGGFGAVGTPGCEKTEDVASFPPLSVGWPLKLREGKGGGSPLPASGTKQRRKEEKTGRGLGWVSLGREKGRRKEGGGGYFLLFLLAGKIS